MDIGVVIVTYNRLTKLKKCLAAYEAQTLSPNYILIIDNCSTDGTKEYLDEWAKHTSLHNPIIIHSPSNSGGSGGFYLGMQEAIKLGAEWIWVADDDAYPYPDCLKKIADAYGILEEKEKETVQALCCKVMDNNGISINHRRCIKRFLGQVKENSLLPEKYNEPIVDIDIFSFVGTVIRKTAIERVGLPYKEYFIFYDDTEYSFRLRNIGAIKCVSDAVILHDSLENSIARQSWKYYYLFRNKMYTYKLYFNWYQCFVARCKIVYMLIRFYPSKLSVIQFRQALRDVRHGKLGFDPKYQP